jgi:hypothetical protein
MARIGTKNHPSVGKRIQIPAYSDLWMRGARFGTIERVALAKGNYVQAGDVRGADIFAVKMDHPQVKRLCRFIADDCQYVREC